MIYPRSWIILSVSLSLLSGASLCAEEESTATPAPLLTQEEEMSINLKNPLFSQGTVSTTEGGVIFAPGIRIQARKISYTNKLENGIRIQKIEAEDDLMMEYGGRAFVGKRLEFDFITKRGTLWEGKTFVDAWFLGGDVLELREDGSFYITNAYVTTSEDLENSWEIKAKNVKISDERLLYAKNIRFEFFRVPLLWLPALTSNLKVFTDAPIRYKVVWDKSLGPRISMRYRFFSWKELDLFFRLDYRLKRGLGGALESEYYSPSGKTTFVTRSYGAHDKEFPDEQGPDRYRFQGLFHTETSNGKTSAHLTYDKLSDSRMVGDFKEEDFDINTQVRTRLVITNLQDHFFSNLSVQPRINFFQSIDQELPLLTMGIRPFSLGNSGIYFSNAFKAGYLDYIYANEVAQSFHALGLPSSTHSARLETRNELYRPFNAGPITMTPSLGVIGIYYSNTPRHTTIGQGILTYGLGAQTRFAHHSRHLLHRVEPYLDFRGLTRPTANFNEHFIFDIYDGYHQLNQLRLGVRNSFFFKGYHKLFPTFNFDLFTYGFFGNKAFALAFPKYYLTAECKLPSIAIRSAFAWNQEERVWDFTNVLAEYTVNEHIAFALEFRHRSKYDWRKADHENFILDVAKPISELVESPISDGRDTFLARLFIRLAPRISTHIQMRHGWGRRNDPPYHAAKIDLFTLLTSTWRLRLSYEHLPNDDRFTAGVNLTK